MNSTVSTQSTYMHCPLLLVKSCKSRLDFTHCTEALLSYREMLVNAYRYIVKDSVAPILPTMRFYSCYPMYKGSPGNIYS